MPGAGRDVRGWGGAGVRPQPGLRRLLLPSGVGLLLEGRAAVATGHCAVPLRLLLHSMGAQAALGDHDRRLSRLRVPPPPVLPLLRSAGRPGINPQGIFFFKGFVFKAIFFICCHRYVVGINFSYMPAYKQISFSPQGFTNAYC